MKTLSTSRASFWKIALLAVAAVAMLCGFRTLPKNATPGKLVRFEQPMVTIDDKTYRLAPGLRAFDQDNRLIFPSQIAVGGKILYQLEPNTGFVKALWLLTPEEAAQFQ